MSKLGTLILTAGLILSTTGLPAAAQHGHNNQQNRYDGHNQGRNDRSQFYNGAHQEIRGGNYGDQGNYRGRPDYRNNQGGIGPGKGALIGGAGGAALGAIFGGGVKGALITGAAGAGIGAVLGGVAQSNRDQNNNYYRR